MWGGRFNDAPAALLEKLNASIHFDWKLYAQDIRASLAHCEMLAECGIIEKKDATNICQGLKEIADEIANGEFTFSTTLEDIHMNIEARLAEKIGDVAGRLHTARSRNDQVATDMRLYVRDAIDALLNQLKTVMLTLSQKALENADLLMPGFTHLQPAQPITFGHHLLAYVEMFERDRQRFTDCRKRVNVNPLGSAALAGTAFPIDRDMTTNKLGFRTPTRNSIDAVSDRDFVIETIFCCAMTAMHISRFAEEVILWSSQNYGFIRLSDSFSTGSSIMPQKRNPDSAELLRAKTGRIYGSLTTLLTVLKALPLAYFKDMQEDKEACFDALETLSLSLETLNAMIEPIHIHKETIENAANAPFITATDMADWLVRSLKIPFRQAHHITGALVAFAEKKNCQLAELSLHDMQSIHPAITEDIFSVLSVKQSVNSRNVFGGTSPIQVTEAAQFWLNRLNT